MADFRIQDRANSVTAANLTDATSVEFAVDNTQGAADRLDKMSLQDVIYVTYVPPLTDTGNTGAAKTLDFSGTASPFQKATLTANCTFTFTAPDTARRLTLLIAQDATGSRTVTWPTLKGATPSIDPTASEITVVELVFDGTNYHTVSA